MLGGTIAGRVLVRRILEGDEEARRKVLVGAYSAVVAVIPVGKGSMHAETCRGSGTGWARKGYQDNAAFQVAQDVPWNVTGTGLRANKCLDFRGTLKPHSERVGVRKGVPVPS